MNDPLIRGAKLTLQCLNCMKTIEDFRVVIIFGAFH